MKNSVKPFVCICVLVAACGCSRNEEKSKCREDFKHCWKLVTDCQLPAPADVRYELFRRTVDDIAAISNATLKIEMAKEFSSLVAKVNLGVLPADDYREFSDRVSRYETLFSWSIGALFDAKVESDYILRQLIDGMEKYRKACYSIPMAARSANESTDVYAKKCQAIYSLASDYEYTMMVLDKCEKGHLRMLSPEFHDRYRKWKKSISQYPKTKEVRERLHSFYRMDKGEGARGVRIR